MRFLKLAILGAAVPAFATVMIADPASAACTRLGFTVNDYGKDGPTRDAKNLLDKYIAKWTAEKGIKNYKTGPKAVKCELFLDFGFFDEHTCRAEASVCWDGPAVPGMPSAKPESAGAPDGTTEPSKPKAAAKNAPAAADSVEPADTQADAAKAETGVTETGSTSKPEAPAETPTPSAQ